MNCCQLLDQIRVYEIRTSAAEQIDVHFVTDYHLPKKNCIRWRSHPPQRLGRGFDVAFVKLLWPFLTIPYIVTPEASFIQVSRRQEPEGVAFAEWLVFKVGRKASSPTVVGTVPLISKANVFISRFAVSLMLKTVNGPIIFR